MDTEYIEELSDYVKLFEQKLEDKELDSKGIEMLKAMKNVQKQIVKVEYLEGIIEELREDNRSIKSDKPVLYSIPQSSKNDRVITELSEKDKLKSLIDLATNLIIRRK